MPPFTSTQLKEMATGSLRCSRARWSEAEPNCSVRTPCPVHAEVYRALVQGAQDRAILEGLHRKVTKAERERSSNSSSPRDRRRQPRFVARIMKKGM